MKKTPPRMMRDGEGSGRVTARGEGGHRMSRRKGESTGSRR